LQNNFHHFAAGYQVKKSVGEVGDVDVVRLGIGGRANGSVPVTPSSLINVAKIVQAGRNLKKILYFCSSKQKSETG
jgi:hypothetical protein